MFIDSCQTQATYIYTLRMYVTTYTLDVFAFVFKTGPYPEKNFGGGFGNEPRGAEDESPQATRPRRRTRRGRWGMGRGVALPSRLGGLGERRELPQRGPGRSPGRKRIWCTLELSESHGGNHFEYSEEHVFH